MRQYKIKVKKIFDTQIAHRTLTKVRGIKTYSDNNISLNKLLKNYLNVENTEKDEISAAM